VTARAGTDGRTAAPGGRRARVVILGGGFGGLYTALELERLAARGAPIEVTLVNRDNYLLFTPMLHEVAASDLDLTHIVNPIRKMAAKTTFVHGAATAVDLDRRVVEVAHGDGAHAHDLPYDHLVVALGSVSHGHGVPGVERAHTMKSLGDAIGLRNRMIAHLEEADYECCAGVRVPLLTVVVAGGGFAGVETAAAAHDFLDEAVRHYPRLAAGDVRVVLVHSGGHLLPELGPELGAYAARKLTARGIEVVLGARVAGFDGNAVTLADGRCFAACTLVWTAGTAPHPLVAALPLEKHGGRVLTDPHLAVPGRDGVWAVGDCAAVPDGRGGHHPPTAQHALRAGRALARNLAARLGVGRAKPFRFGGLGQLAAIGRRTGVAKVFGWRFSGFVAWWMWRTVYLAKLPRLEKKLRVMFDWTLDLVFTKDLVQFETRSEAARAESGPARHAGEAHARDGAEGG
jgi:NADH dehydrogenase